MRVNVSLHKVRILYQKLLGQAKVLLSHTAISPETFWNEERSIYFQREESRSSEEGAMFRRD